MKEPRLHSCKQQVHVRDTEETAKDEKETQTHTIKKKM